MSLANFSAAAAAAAAASAAAAAAAGSGFEEERQHQQQQQSGRQQSLDHQQQQQQHHQFQQRQHQPQQHYQQQQQQYGCWEYSNTSNWQQEQQPQQQNSQQQMQFDIDRQLWTYAWVQQQQQHNQQQQQQLHQQNQQQQQQQQVLPEASSEQECPTTDLPAAAALAAAAVPAAAPLDAEKTVLAVFRTTPKAAAAPQRPRVAEAIEAAAASLLPPVRQSLEAVLAEGEKKLAESGVVLENLVKDVAEAELEMQEISSAVPQDLVRFVEEVAQVQLQLRSYEEKSIEELLERHVRDVKSLGSKQEAERTAREKVLSENFITLCREVRNSSKAQTDTQHLT